MLDNLTFGSYNVNGLQNRAKRKKIFMWIKDHKLDIALLQESHCKPSVVNLWQVK